MPRTRMVDNGQFAVSLLDLEFGRGGRHPEGVVVGSVGNHGGRCEQDPTTQSI